MSNQEATNNPETVLEIDEEDEKLTEQFVDILQEEQEDTNAILEKSEVVIRERSESVLKRNEGRKASGRGLNSKSTIEKYWSQKTVFVTGVTGFLAKVLVAQILYQVPDVQRIYVLIRAKVDRRTGKKVSPKERLDELINVPLFEGLKELAKKKLVIVEGDFHMNGLGISTELKEEITSSVQIIVNSAASINFREEIDIAYKTNVMGAVKVMELAKKCTKLEVFVDVSTAFVNGRRKGPCDEKNFDANKSIAHEMGISGISEFDVDKEIEYGLACGNVVRQEAKMPTRKKYFQDLAKKYRNSSKLKNLTDEQAVEFEERRWIQEELVRRGQERAEYYQWTDVYTFTKAIAEMKLESIRGNIPLVVMRPSIIEGCISSPLPGWIEGVKVSDPIVLALGKGVLKDLPADPNGIIDLIPADYVVNAIMAAATTLANKTGAIEVYHCATAHVVPFTANAFVNLTYDYFMTDPLSSSSGQKIKPKKPKLKTLEEWEQSQSKKVKLLALPAYVNKSAKRALRGLARLNKYHRIYMPYYRYEASFKVDNLISLWNSLNDEDRNRFDFDVRLVEHNYWLKDIHFPGLRKYALGGR